MNSLVSEQIKSRTNQQYQTSYDEITTSEQRLWIAVIARAITDAFSRSVERAAAIQWLTEGTDNFISVCEMSGIDSQKALKVFRKQKWERTPLDGLPLRGEQSRFNAVTL